MNSFSEIFSKFTWNEISKSIYSKTAADVELALQKSKRDLEDLKALLSPAAAPYLEQMAQLSHQLTQKRFGKTVQMYVPLYLSNECQNICTYCGFSLDNKIKRKTLSDEEIILEAVAIKKLGFDHLLLVTGEANQIVGVNYIKHAINILRPYFSHISIEVQPLDQNDYAKLIEEGLNTVLVYQETYHKEEYKTHHPKGKKSNFNYRLETPDRLGKAGIWKMGLGVLIGLEDWRTDSFFCALHLDYLEKKYWKSKFSISFPRIRPHEISVLPSRLSNLERSSPPVADRVRSMSDKELVQLICAYRIFNEEIELSISTRESEKFRDHIIQLGITSMSAGSKTNPGGYEVEKTSLEQFEIDDARSPDEIAEMIRTKGYEPVWKDWDAAYQLQKKDSGVLL